MGKKTGKRSQKTDFKAMEQEGKRMVLNILKLILFSYLTLIGLITTFGVVWLKCGLVLTKDAITLLVVLSAVVSIPYILWMVR